MHLLALRAQIRLARQAHDLLDDKRKQLMEEFRRASDTALAGSDELEAAAAEATRTLRLAEALKGREVVASDALAASGEIFLEMELVSIAGVRVPRIEQVAVGRPRIRRGYGLSSTDPLTDAVADRYEAELELILHVAEDELRLRRLAAEIGATTRRVNALEQLFIPGLERRFRQIRSVLDEREREDHFRLRRVKGLLARRTVEDEGAP
jgi:V/A-type H+-transporting ATPase subunit D